MANKKFPKLNLHVYLNVKSTMKWTASFNFCSSGHTGIPKQMPPLKSRHQRSIDKNEVKYKLHCEYYKFYC